MQGVSGGEDAVWSTARDRTVEGRWATDRGGAALGRGHCVRAVRLRRKPPRQRRRERKVHCMGSSGIGASPHGSGTKNGRLIA